MTTTKLFVFAQFAAFWPVWNWYFQRMLDGSDEPWGILALITVLLLAVKKGTWNVPSKQVMINSSVIVACYAMSYGYMPPLIRGILAVIALSFSISSIGYGRTVHAGTFGLMLLSLPLIASLQFYGGFPIRVITAFASSQILELLGYPVRPQGTLLFWQGEVIAVDAPCAGIKMMWTGLYLNFTLVAWREMGFFASWLSTSFTLFCVFLGNILRATLLFFTESGIVNVPNSAHQMVGIVVFALVALAVLSFHHLNRKSVQCAI